MRTAAAIAFYSQKFQEVRYWRFFRKNLSDFLFKFKCLFLNGTSMQTKD